MFALRILCVNYESQQIKDAFVKKIKKLRMRILWEISRKILKLENSTSCWADKEGYSKSNLHF